MKRKLVQVLSIIFVLALLFAPLSCSREGGSNAASSPQGIDDGRVYGDDIVIGLTTPVTGPQAAGGQQAEYGARLKIDQINAEGGIELSDGWHLVRLTVVDDQGDTTLVDTTVRRLAASGVSAMLGPYFSGMALALDSTMREVQIPIVNSTTSILIDDLENPWIWHTRCDDGLNVLILGKAVIDDYVAINGSTDGLVVGIVCANDETGTSAASSYIQYFEEQGVNYYVDYHNPNDADLSAYVQKAIAAGVNAWVSSTHDIAAVAFAKAMYEAGLRNQIVYMNPILAQTQVLAMMEPEWIEGWGCACDYSTTDTRPLQAAFTAAWAEKYGNNPTPDVQGALYYAHTTVVIEAIKAADSADPKAIRDAIAQMNGLETVVGTVYADTYTNLIYEIGIAKIFDSQAVVVGSVSMAADFGFGL